MLKRHWDHLLTYLKHHITNAVTEGLNSKIQNIKSAAFLTPGSGNCATQPARPWSSTPASGCLSNWRLRAVLLRK